MNKLMRIVLVLLLCVLLPFGGAFAAGSAGVARTDICMPKLELSFYPENDISTLDIGDVSATLGDEALTVDSLGADDSPIFCVFMLDVSRSMPDGHFAAAKQAIADICGSLRQQDEMALFACGSQVTEILSGSIGEDAADTIMALKNDDSNTMFYSGIESMVKAVQEKSGYRTYAVVISDGVDDTDTGLTHEQLTQILSESGVCVNGLCVDTAQQGTFDIFSETVSVSGGEISEFSAGDIGDIISAQVSDLQDLWKIGMIAPSNIASGEETPLTVKLGDVETVELFVTPQEWTPDMVAPAVVAADFDLGKNCFTVEYSEPVSGADALAAYSLSVEGGDMIAVATVENWKDNIYRVYPSQPIAAGSEVTLSISGPSDISMEKNPLEDFSKVISCGTTVTKPNMEDKQAQPDDGIGLKTILLICAGFVVVAVALIVVITASTKKHSADKSNAKPAEAPDKKKKEKKKKEKSTATFVFEDKDDDK